MKRLIQSLTAGWHFYDGSLLSAQTLIALKINKDDKDRCCPTD